MASRLPIIFGLCLGCFGVSSAMADVPLYVVHIQSNAWLEVLQNPGASDALMFWPLSEGAARILIPSQRKIVGCGYTSGIEFRTKQPDPIMAAEDVLAQISRQTGLQLHYSVDSTLTAIKPIVLLQGCSESSVVTVLLTPTGPDRYRLSCAFEIDARPPGSIDGTPAAIEAMKRSEEEVTATFNRDSIISQLPAEISESDVKKAPAGSYFRSPVLVSTRIHGGWGQALVLMLRRQGHYIVGFYLQAGGIWHIVERPVEISGTKDPYLTNAPNGNVGAVGAVAEGSNGVYLIYLDDEKLIFRRP